MNIIQIAAGRLNVSVTELADLLSIPYRTVYKWQTGEREPPAAAITAVKLLMFVDSHNLTGEWINERNSIMENKLVMVAEAIMDSAAEEHRAINLANTQSVQTYAEKGMDIYLTDKEAGKVLAACLGMVKRIEVGDIPNSNVWYDEITKTLSN